MASEATPTTASSPRRASLSRRLRRPDRIRPAQMLGCLPHPDQLRRHSAHDGVGGNILRHYCASADDRVVADGDAAQDLRAVADPDVVADADVALVDALHPDRPLDL